MRVRNCSSHTATISDFSFPFQDKETDEHGEAAALSGTSQLLKPVNATAQRSLTGVLGAGCECSSSHLTYINNYSSVALEVAGERAAPKMRPLLLRLMRAGKPRSCVAYAFFLSCCKRYENVVLEEPSDYYEMLEHNRRLPLSMLRMTNSPTGQVDTGHMHPKEIDTCEENIISARVC